MSGRAGRGAGPGRLASAAHWGGAALVVLAAHAGAIVWMLREPPVAAAEFSPPTAIMIELAPEPEAVATEENRIAPDETETEEVASETEEPVEEPALQPPPEPLSDAEPEEARPQEPVREVAEIPPPPLAPPTKVEPPPPEPEIAEAIPPAEEADPLEALMLESLEGVAIPVPAARPTPPQKRSAAKAEPKKQPAKEAARDPKRQKPAPSAKASRKAAAEVRQSARTAARQTASGYASPSLTPAKWQSRLMSHLERRKRYPRGALSRGETAIAHVRFRIDAAGNVLSASLARSSGNPALDAEVVALVRRASPVPAPPPDASKTITAPVRFSGR